MKSLVAFISLFLLCGVLRSQDLKELESESYGDKINFAVGLPKISAVELEFLKTDFNAFSQIVYSEFIFKDHILLIECDPKAKPISYPDIEIILHKYFDPTTVHRKYIVSFEELKKDGEKSDKYKIK
jgi:hypothetical protein